MSRLIEKLMNCKSSSSLKRQVTFSPCTDRVCVCVCVCESLSRVQLFAIVYREDRSGVRQTVVTVLGKVTFSFCTENDLNLYVL